MNTLVVYYSKTGNTKKVAQSVIGGIDCEYDELQYDEKAKSISYAHDPSDFEHIILLSPVWAFSLAEPMKLYLAKEKGKIKNYDLIVTCGAMGLQGCVKNCESAIGKAPDNAMKFKAAKVKSGEYDLSPVLQR